MLKIIGPITCSFCNQSISDLTRAAIGHSASICDACIFDLKDGSRDEFSNPQVFVRDPELDKMTLDALLPVLALDAPHMERSFGDILDAYKNARSRTHEDKKPRTINDFRGDSSLMHLTFPDLTLLEKIPLDLCERHNIFPISIKGPRLFLAVADPADINGIDDVRFLTGLTVECVAVDEAWIAEMIRRSKSKT